MVQLVVGIHLHGALHMLLGGDGVARALISHAAEIIPSGVAPCGGDILQPHHRRLILPLPDVRNHLTDL